MHAIVEHAALSHPDAIVTSFQTSGLLSVLRWRRCSASSFHNSHVCFVPDMPSFGSPPSALGLNEWHWWRILPQCSRRSAANVVLGTVEVGALGADFPVGKIGAHLIR